MKKSEGNNICILTNALSVYFTRQTIPIFINQYFSALKEDTQLSTNPQEIKLKQKRIFPKNKIFSCQNIFSCQAKLSWPQFAKISGFKN